MIVFPKKFIVFSKKQTSSGSMFGITKLDHFGWWCSEVCFQKIQGCRSVPQKHVRKQSRHSWYWKWIYIDIGVSPGFGGFDSGPNLQPCKINGWNLQTIHLQKEKWSDSKPPWGHGTQPLIFQGCTTGSTIRTLLHVKINPKDWQVLSLGDVGFLLFF